MELEELFASDVKLPGMFVGNHRALTADELDSLPPPVAKPIHALRASHHELARLVASGLSPVECSRLTGKSVSSIQSLKADPAFKELVAHYNGVAELEYRNFHTALAELAQDSVEILHERLLENPESVPTDVLLKIVEATSDRTGFGKTQTVNLNSLNLTADLARLQQEFTDSHVEKISPDNRRAVVGELLPPTEPHSSPDRVEGEKRGGEAV